MKTYCSFERFSEFPRSLNLGRRRWVYPYAERSWCTILVIFWLRFCPLRSFLSCFMVCPSLPVYTFYGELTILVYSYCISVKQQHLKTHFHGTFFHLSWSECWQLVTYRYIILLSFLSLEIFQREIQFTWVSQSRDFTFETARRTWWLLLWIFLITHLKLRRQGASLLICIYMNRIYKW